MSEDLNMETSPNTDVNKKSLEDYMSDVTKRLNLKSDLLRDNKVSTNNWPDEKFFSMKDSTLKKNTAFVKKIRNLTESSKQSLLNDFEGLNLSKYVGEVAAAITEPKVKMSDIPFMLRLCSLMYRRYSDFSSHFMDAWKKVFTQPKSEKTQNISKYRVDLVLYADLITVGVLPETESVRLLAMQLTQLTNGDKESFTHIGTVTSFLKACGDDWAGLIPRKYSSLAKEYNETIRRSAFLSNERKKKCRALFQDYYKAALARLTDVMARDARKALASNRHAMRTKGEVHPERKEQAENLLNACKKFHESVSLLADAVDQDAPPSMDSLVKMNDEDDEASKLDGQSLVSNGGDGANNSLFEDEDARLFYESLQDIRAMIPAILYKDSENATATIKTEKSVKKKEEISEEQLDEISELDIETVEQELANVVEEDADEALICPKTLEIANGMEASSASSAAEGFKNPPSAVEASARDKASSAELQEEGPPSAKMMMDTFLSQLPKCVNRDLIDKAAYDFCLNLNKKSNRRRLANTLATVPRNRYDLLPFYARLVATLHPLMPDVAQELTGYLLDEFRWYMTKKDHTHLESKIKTMRFIGELVKFRVFPADEALGCVKRLLGHFVHHQIDMACALLETCGRFLFRSPETHRRTEIYLEVMMRKKATQYMDQRYSVMIDNTFYVCNPPPKTANFGQVVRTPMQRYLRKLVCRDLNAGTVNAILKAIRSLNWEDREVVDDLKEVFTKAWEVGFNTIEQLASVLAGLMIHHRDFAVEVVDAVIEDIRTGMELNGGKANQRRLSMVHYLGQMYNYKVIDSPVVFSVLYSLISFGVSWDYLKPSLIDPPTSVMRILLVCYLLQSCGRYFLVGSRRKKLLLFLAYFQHYYWFKRSHPIYLLSSVATAAKEAQQQQGGVEGEAAGADGSSIPPNNISPTESEGKPFPLLPPVPVELEQFQGIVFPEVAEHSMGELLDHLSISPHYIVHSLDEAQENLEKTMERCQLTANPSKPSPVGIASRVVGLKKNLSDAGSMDVIPEEDYSRIEEFELDEGADEDSANQLGSGDGSEILNNRPQGGVDSYDDNLETATAADDEDYDVDEDEECDGEDEETGGDIDGEREGGGYSSSDNEDEDGEEEDELVRKGLRPKLIHCPEDDEFVAQLERMTAEAIMPASAISGGAPTVGTAGGGMSSSGISLLPSLDSLGVGAAAAARKAAARSTASTDSILATLTDKRSASPQQQPPQEKPTEDSAPSTVQFSLLVRRSAANASNAGSGSNKPKLLSFSVPETVPFAANLLKLKAEEQAEKARLKERVLEMHKAQKEADEMNGASGPDLIGQLPSNLNRDRWVKYNHPKRAPDAEAVFGTSSVQMPPPPPSIPSYLNHRSGRR